MNFSLITVFFIQMIVGENCKIDPTPYDGYLLGDMKRESYSTSFGAASACLRKEECKGFTYNGFSQQYILRYSYKLQAITIKIDHQISFEIYDHVSKEQLCT